MTVARLLFAAALLPSLATATPLGDYKDQKHGDRERVEPGGCVEAWIAKHEPNAPKGDAHVREKAEAFCRERAKRKTAKTAELVVKGASVGAGAAAVATQNTVQRSRTNSSQVARPAPTQEFEPWPRVVAELGAGLQSRTVAGTSVLRTRFDIVGGAVTSTFFADGVDWLSETDVGPIGYIDSANLEFGLAPVLLISAANDVSTRLGGGLRSYTTADLGRVLLHFDPMLGLINGQWNYHLRIGGSYQITRHFYTRLSYDFRDILDLTDLNISQASLQGVMLTAGFRFR
ncbi:MAG: hypothetical protein EP330_00775 [Deltaproteobacteria bacterium]|nr:MAG: hypothetical protein EP330_00775 [Deltaproteobacteria bacterium]